MTLIEHDYADFKPEKYNRQFEEAHAKIIEANHELTDEKGRAPTFKAIADKTGYHINTIYRHYEVMRTEQAVKPRYKLYSFEIINRHLELMRQKDDLRVALQATLTLEERILDIITKTEIEVKDVKQKRLVIEIQDKRNELLEEAQVVDEDKSSTQ